jgi:hypothetical protein
MKRFKRLPTPAMVVAIIALVLALAGTSVAAGLGILNTKAKNKTVGVGPLTYVTTTQQLAPSGNIQLTTATCPGGNPIGGGAKVTSPAIYSWQVGGYINPNSYVGQFYVFGGNITVNTVVACANSRVVTGTPPS